MLRDQILKYALKKYSAEPEYLWAKFPLYAVLRHAENKKWFALIMNVPREKLGLEGGDEIDILNLKMQDFMQKDILIHQEKGIIDGYHISKGNWISVLLDGSVKFEKICELLDVSFEATLKACKKPAVRAKKDWLVPANPKFYDIVHAFDKNDEILWKQSSDVRVGDGVFIYVAAPVSTVLYGCEAVEVNLPYDYRENGLNITKVMKLKLIKRYAARSLATKF